MRPYYEYIIIDLPASFSDTTITACENCEEIFLIYNNEILSLRNARVCYGILEQLHQREKIRFVINKFEKGLVKNEDFEEMFQTKMFATVPADYSSALSSINRGLAVTVAHPKSAISKGISDIADKIIEAHTGVVPIKEKETKRKSFFKK